MNEITRYPEYFFQRSHSNLMILKIYLLSEYILNNEDLHNKIVAFNHHRTDPDNSPPVRNGYSFIDNTCLERLFGLKRKTF